jgi:hypothetical protein
MSSERSLGTVAAVDSAIAIELSLTRRGRAAPPGVIWGIATVAP